MMVVGAEQPHRGLMVAEAFTSADLPCAHDPSEASHMGYGASSTTPLHVGVCLAPSHTLLRFSLASMGFPVSLPSPTCPSFPYRPRHGILFEASNTQYPWHAAFHHGFYYRNTCRVTACARKSGHGDYTPARSRLHIMTPPSCSTKIAYQDRRAWTAAVTTHTHTRKAFGVFGVFHSKPFLIRTSYSVIPDIGISLYPGPVSLPL
ncbi:hypothetical protein K504DRAFT_130472 [Pleomassaria siparia CBS 279.74]|uniref:Uncharacterized protein n=1 Tax=Pleomassaria siparia CBS 279.74 TaxID=1314801 RepID=A0A6G1KJY3_9PLEO|nr:hypothetical protein K504DRAFT_130472 [Pleomassaria siparia CBS 279.74]